MFKDKKMILSQQPNIISELTCLGGRLVSFCLEDEKRMAHSSWSDSQTQMINDEYSRYDALVTWRVRSVQDSIVSGELGRVHEKTRFFWFQHCHDLCSLLAATTK